MAMATAGEAADRDRPSGQSGDGGPRPPRLREASGGSPFEVFKAGQGKTVRWATGAAAFAIALAFAAFLQEQLAFAAVSVRYTVPAVALIGLSYLAFRLVGQNRRVSEFLIATEGEMKKVNWSTRKEVIGATKVVIVTVLAMGFLLFFVNLVFMFLFELIGVLRVSGVSKMFESPGQ
ncbi:MAG: preprotein translocase subunit SecE [Phycisphaerae bacterium]